MKQGKFIRRAVSAALAGCMMFTLSAPALAELLWQNAGCPQPTVTQATDAAAAARWCVEQGYLEEDFAPEKYVPKYKVIRILKQAKSAT